MQLLWLALGVWHPVSRLRVTSGRQLWGNCIVLSRQLITLITGFFVNSAELNDTEETFAAKLLGSWNRHTLASFLLLLLLSLSLFFLFFFVFFFEIILFIQYWKSACLNCWLINTICAFLGNSTSDKGDLKSKWKEIHVKVDVIQTDVMRIISTILLLWSFISTSSTLHLIQYQGGPVLLKELASWKRGSFLFLFFRRRPAFLQHAEEIKTETWNRRFCFKMLSRLYFQFKILLAVSGTRVQKTLSRVTYTTLHASLSGTFLTPLKGHSLFPRCCPPTLSAPSERCWYW